MIKRTSSPSTLLVIVQLFGFCLLLPAVRAASHSGEANRDTYPTAEVWTAIEHSFGGTGDSVIIRCGTTRIVAADLIIEKGQVLMVDSGATLLIPTSMCLYNQGKLINHGALWNLGELRNEGTIENEYHVFNSGGLLRNTGSFVNACGARVISSVGGSFVQSAGMNATPVAMLRHGASTQILPPSPVCIPPENLAVADEDVDIEEERAEGEGEGAAERAEEIEARDRFEFDQLKNPRTGTIPLHIRNLEYQFAGTLPRREDQRIKGGGMIQTANTYTSLGPDNLGGRTRAIAFDITNSNIMLSGGVSTGIFRSTDAGNSWTNVTPSGQLHSVVSIAQDPRSGYETTWYYGTGEASGNTAGGTGAFYYGQGMFKSTDNGQTWAQLSSTSSTLESFNSPFDLVHRIVVDPTSGYVYAACQRVIECSTNGGSTWSPVLGEFGGNTSTGFTDIIVSTAGRFYAAFPGTTGSTTGSGLPPSSALDGVWTSTSGAAGTWTRIAGSASPTGWNAAASYGRVVLALAPSNQNILYALYDNKNVSSCAGTPAIEADFFKYDQSTSIWTDRSANLPDETGCSDGNDPFAVQGGYDLTVAVKPDDENFVVIGGTTAYRSTNGFATSGASTRIGGYAGPTSYSLYTNHHPDVHTLVFHPTTSTTLVSGDDGGIQKTSDVTAGTVSWTSLNNGYVTYQYYHIALDPTVGSLNTLGGAQDNGTTVSTGSASQTPVWSGDGCATGISDNNSYHFVSSQNGSISRRTPSQGNGFGTSIKPAGSGSGVFVTYYYLNPDNTEQLWYTSSNTLYRTLSASTVTTAGWTLMTGVGTAVGGANTISCISTSRGMYRSSHKLYIGASNAKLYRLDDPASAAASTTPVSIGDATWTGYVSGIAVDPTDDSKVLVTFSNYGITSVYYTGNAGAATPTWTAVEGNLTLPSIRSCAVVSRNGSPTEYYVGTSVGLYSTATLNGASTVWAQEGAATLGRCVVRSIAYRPFDNRMLLGTHGNGLFYTDIPDPAMLPREWRGGTSAAWATTTNWSHGAVPGSNDDVLIPASGVTSEASISTAVSVHSLTVESGRTLTVTGSGSLTVTGNLTSSGTVAVHGTLAPGASSTVDGSGTLNGSGTVQVPMTGAATDDFGTQYPIATKTLSGLTVEFNGTAPQKSATPSFGGLKINNAAGVSLQSTTTVNGTLTLGSGLLELGPSNLILGLSAAIAGSPGPTSMIVPTSTGELRKTLNGPGSFTFPIGDNTGIAEYSPSTLNFTSGTFSSAWAGLRLTNAKHPSNTSPNHYLNRFWTVSSSGISSFSCNASFTYVDADVVGTEANIHTGKYDTPSWTVLNAAVPASNLLGGTVTGFSDFTGGEAGALPVELVSFTAHQLETGIAFTWRTVTEANNYGFQLQRSLEGAAWVSRAFIGGYGTTNAPHSYESVDALSSIDRLQPVWYYRLLQIDRNGCSSVSPTLEVRLGQDQHAFSLGAAYPNPLNGSQATCTIGFVLPSQQVVSFTVYDLLGKAVAHPIIASSFEAGVHAIRFQLSTLPDGVYIYELSGASGVLRKTVRLVQ